MAAGDSKLSARWGEGLPVWTENDKTEEGDEQK